MAHTISLCHEERTIFMGAVFWVKRYLLAAVPLFAILAAVEWLKGSAAAVDYLSALAWALFAAWIFTVAAYRRYRKMESCAACEDIGQRGKAKK
jgi:hypothetical protein